MKIKSFIHRSPVYNYYEVARDLLQHHIKYGNKGQLITNYDDTADLIDHIETVSNLLKDGHRQMKNKENVEGMKFEIMLPELFTTKSIKFQHMIAKQIINCIKATRHNLKYIATIHTHRNSCYMSVLFVDREVYPEGLVIDNVACSDWYFSKITGKRVKSTHEDAVLRYRTGDVLNKKTIHLGPKIQHWNGSEWMLVAYCERLKSHVTNILRRKFKLIPENRYRLVQNSIYHNNTWKHDLTIYSKEYWWLIRKNILINTYIIALNKRYAYDAPTSQEDKKIRSILRKWKHMTIYNLKTFEEHVNLHIQRI